MKRYIVIVIFFNFHSLPYFYAQKSDKSQIYTNIEHSITNINKLLGSNCNIKFNAELIATFYENGVPFREDRVYPDALDPHSVHFVEEEKVVSVQCIKFDTLAVNWHHRFGEGCISREFFNDNKLLFYSRMAFFASDANKKELEQELKNLILLGHELTFK